MLCENAAGETDIAAGCSPLKTFLSSHHSLESLPLSPLEGGIPRVSFGLHVPPSTVTKQDPNSSLPPSPLPPPALPPPCTHLRNRSLSTSPELPDILASSSPAGACLAMISLSRKNLTKFCQSDIRT